MSEVHKSKMITIIGSFFGTSGYSKHTRYLANALNKLEDVSINTQLVQGWEADVNDQELEMIKRESDNEINLIITHPVNWKVNCQAKRNFVYLIWEGDRVPKWIADECLNENIERIIVPSVHTKQALEKTIEEWEGTLQMEILDKVMLAPHGVDHSIFYPIDSQRKEEIIGDPPDSLETRSTAEEENQGGKTVGVDNHADFKFLANKGLRNTEDRGGIQYLIRAYCQEFTNEDNIELILKINSAYGIPNLLALFPELKEPNCPKIRYVHESLTNAQLNELYNECDVFVSPTRSEAFNLPCIEALSCGKPVITTSFGGQTDYVHELNGWLVGGTLNEVEHELEYEGVKWLTPYLDDLRATLREVYENRDFTSKSDCAKETSLQYTWDHTAKGIYSQIRPEELTKKLMEKCYPKD